ncbi:hypothetical protein BD779DRAFT_1565904 [Infundibulicybe gibba]|nr:hypothetical protein BD779DRAFT_1565904 [Infundibulicybe gibba]
MVYNLPVLIESPYYALSPYQYYHFCNQMFNILHTLASIFTTSIFTGPVLGAVCVDTAV